MFKVYLDKKKKKQILRIALIILVVVVICVPAFMYFRISTGANTALRKAKNINLSFIAVDIEYYGKNMSVYDPYRPGGMSEGVEERVRQDLDEDADFAIISYDRERRKVTELRYYDGEYLVNYKHDETGDHWTVDYLFNIIGK